MRALKRAVKAVLCWPGLRRISERAIVGKYRRVNRRSQEGKQIRTPWICEFKDPDAERWIRYKDEVFSDYFRLSGLPREAVRGKRILEIGPGETLGVAVEFLMAGAAEVVCSDRFPSLAPSPRQVAVYRGMRERLDEAGKAAFDSILTLSGDTYAVNPERLKYVTDSPLETLSETLAGPFDFIVSRAVLEHVYDLDASMDSMARLLAPGGLLLHEVDFRDHGMFSYLGLNPLTYLAVSDADWAALGSHIGAPNRRLVDYFENKLDALGFRRNIVVKHLFGSETVVGKPVLESGRDFGRKEERMAASMRKRLLPRYRSLPLEKLLVSVIFFSATKPIGSGPSGTAGA